MESTPKPQANPPAMEETKREKKGKPVNFACRTVVLFAILGVIIIGSVGLAWVLFFKEGNSNGKDPVVEVPEEKKSK